MTGFDYIDLGLEADPTVLRQNGRDWIVSQAPDGYVIDPWTDWILGAVARMAVEVVVLTSRVPLSIFRVFGQRVLRIPALDATAAVGVLNVTTVDSGTYGLDAGADFLIGDQSFQSTLDVTLTGGGGTVPVVAVDSGTAGSGLTGSATLVSPNVLWLSSAVLDSETTGGLDGETDEEYVDRLADEIPILSPKAILLDDFATLSRRDLEVTRALAVKGYVPASGGTAITTPPGSATGSVQTGVDGAVTIFVHGPAGVAVSGGAKSRILASLGSDAQRIANMVISIAEPTFTNLKVRYTVLVFPGEDITTAQDTIDGAIVDFLAKDQWGRRPGADSSDWAEETVLRRDDLVGVVYKVPAVRHVLTLTMAIGAGTLATSNLTLTGPAALPGTLDVDGTASYS